jgi:hypothetical protein
VSLNKILRKIFGSKVDEASGQFRILHNKELCDLNKTQSIVRILNEGDYHGLDQCFPTRIPQNIARGSTRNKKNLMS